MKTLIVGDVHGCAAPLATLIAEANPDRVLLLGDIFAKGPDPAGVWELIQKHGARAILGNHDARLLEVWGQPGDSAHHRCWRLLPEAARLWTAGLPLTLAEDDWVAVHAGVNPLLGVEGTTREQLLTLRRWPDDANLENPFWWQLYPKVWVASPEGPLLAHARSGPSIRAGHGSAKADPAQPLTSQSKREQSQIVENDGATQKKQPVLARQRQNWLGTGAPKRIFYGHDAVRGVQDHGSTVGLDSGCVYGGKLSGMILESGEILQVRGRNR